MPAKRCQSGGSSGWKWGSRGKCYTGAKAKYKAHLQGCAIGDLPGCSKKPRKKK